MIRDDKVEKMMESLKIKDNVIFEGHVEDIIQYYYSSDIFVLPSNYEGRARVLVEAMACGMPVITTDVSGASDVIIEGENGFIVPGNNSKALAQKIVYLLENPELRKEMGERGKRYVKENLDIKKNAYKYRELYEKTIGLAKREK